MIIWKKMYCPFVMGGQPWRKVKTEVENTIPVVDLGKGFKGIYIKGQGVFEVESGGLVGNTIEDVKNDIARCESIELMCNQVKNSLSEREDAHMISYEEFIKG